MNRSLLLTVLALAACRTDKDILDEDEIEPEIIDDDGDGFAEEDDCNDWDASIFPDATEICDGIDNDCDGEIDEEVLSTWYADTDDDGFGDALSTMEACEGSDGWVATGNDCDDEDADSYPGATERCDDADNDCDGEIDEDVLGTWYPDADSDGYGDPDQPYEICDPPSGYVEDSTDCNDMAPSAWPGAEEVCDEIDNDCDGSIDEDVQSTFYVDSDGDGYGLGTETQDACTEPSGYSETSGDCDDSSAQVSPAATEVCDGIDNDCDDEVDEADAADAATWYLDSDGDGFGDATSTDEACDTPSGYVSDDTDCDDSEGAVSPDATEICDGIDNDCDGDIDDADSSVSDASTFYIDYDSDGYGSDSYTTEACEVPSGYVSDDTDCDDTDAASNPDATEICDEIDNDCDGDIDSDDSDLDADTLTTWYEDADSDGYGNADSASDTCEAPSGYVEDSTDCDDEDGAVNPEALEVCDEIDNDCDGDIDDEDDSMEGTGLTTLYLDADLDGYGDPDTTIESCTELSGYVDDDTDCNDSYEEINPGAEEICDELDNDCDGETDEEVYGMGEDCAATDCQDVLDSGSGTSDGVYWIAPDGSAFEALCDLTTDDGGWTLLLAADGSSTYWGNNSEYWYSDGSDTTPSTLDGADFHGQAYQDLVTDGIRLCYGDVDTCYTFEHGLGITLLDFFDTDTMHTEYSYGSYGISDAGSSSAMSNYLSDMGATAQSTNCQWLGINNYRATSAIGLMGDWNGGCDGGGYPYHDDLAIGVGLQSCYDDNGCTYGGSGHLAGQSRGWDGTDDSGVYGPWYVWGR